MKKRGFTLAEVLVAMALIGVISALTIPTFVSNSRNKANATKLAATVSAVENAFTSMISAEGASDLTETEILDENGNVKDLEKKLGNYLKISKTSIEGHIGYTAENYYHLTKNGSIIGFIYDYKELSDDKLKELTASITSFIAEVVIDINGEAKPNAWGRDAFLFALGNDGTLYPAGSKEFAMKNGSGNDVWNVSGPKYSCVGGNITEGCTARLVQNNYEVDY